jgi:hypothetical protein
MNNNAQKVGKQINKLNFSDINETLLQNGDIVFEFKAKTKSSKLDIITIVSDDQCVIRIRKLFKEVAMIETSTNDFSNAIMLLIEKY